MIKLIDTVNMMSILFDYVSEKIGDEKTPKLLAHLGLDNPHILKTKEIEDWKKNY